ncbi:DNA polymerase IV [Marinomonas epiphytica]
MQANRKIIHIDADCFFAAIEMRDDPSLRDIPIAIGGPAERRGVLATANYVARQYGVRSAMATAHAKRLCPELKILNGNMAKYREASQLMHEVFREYTDIIEPLSLDEAYLDVSQCEQLQGSATLIAQAIREKVFQRVGITVSAGVATNKFLAKVASDWQKPDGLTVVSPAKQTDFVAKVPVKSISGIGKVAQEKLAKLNVFSCEDLQKVDFTTLQKQFGSMAFRLSQYALGVDERPVQTSRQRKSISVEHTFDKDISDLSGCVLVLPRLIADLNKRMQGKSYENQLKKYYLKIKFHDFTQTTIEKPIHSKLSDKVFTELLVTAYERQAKPVRLIGVGYRLNPPAPQQLCLSF